MEESVPVKPTELVTPKDLQPSKIDQENGSDIASLSNSLSSMNTSNYAHEDTTPRIARKERKRLGIVKIILVLVLLVATVMISFAIHYTTRSGEVAQFEVQFEDQAARLLEEFGLLFLGSLGAIDNFGVTITSHVRSMNMVWPYAFVPEFDIRAASTSSLSKAKFLAFTPVVLAEDLEEFEEYSVQVSFWVNQSLARKYGRTVPASPMVHNHGGRRFLQNNMNMNMSNDGGDSTMASSNSSSSMMIGDDTDMMMAGTNSTMTDQGEDIMSGMNGSSTMNGDIMGANSTMQDDMIMQSDMGDTTDHSGHDMGNMGDTTDHSGHDMGDMSDMGDIDHHSGHNMSGGMHNYPTIFPHVYYNVNGQTRFPDRRSDSYLPTFQCEPVAPNLVNFNLLSHEVFGQEFEIARSTNQMVVGKLVNEPGTDPMSSFIYSQSPGVGPFSQIVFPIFSNFQENIGSSGFLSIYIFWADFFADNLPDTVKGIVCIFENACGQQVSYEINSESKATYLGEGDLHDTEFDDLVETMTFMDAVGGVNQEGLTYSGVFVNQEYCPYTLRVYPSAEMKTSMMTNKPLVYTLLVVGTFIITCLTILGYDLLNEKRNQVVMENARQTNLIVSSLFPAIVRDRLFGKDGGKGFSRSASKKYLSTRNRLRNYLDEGDQKKVGKTKPIADLFPYTTIMFADIAGFTAWSSLREPSQVFTLLETLYGSFDALAKKKSVFKVETIGDCYVCATGLPDPQRDHAPIMALFSNECLKRFAKITKSLEISLGPDTADLNLRIGVNSGPVTAGVLRGEKSRFQLFGDTVNTASRMESTSVIGRIQCSQTTADLLSEAGKTEWLTVREEPVDVKGKGMVQTYWIDSDLGEADDDDPQEDLDQSNRVRFELQGVSVGNSLKRESGLWGDVIVQQREVVSQNQRLIDWHVELLGGLLKQIVAHRSKKSRSNKANEFQPACSEAENPTPLSEFTEIIVMPKFDPKKAKKIVDPESVELPPQVLSQLIDYVSTLSCMYQGNPFHNFAHASHVTMAANKLLGRVVAPDQVLSKADNTKTLALSLHDYTFGLTSDPITQFAVVFSALIHDVDHAGVSNFQLVKENTDAAIKYTGKSVAEQNSIDLAWEMLMDPSLGELRSCIYTNEEEFRRFRQLVVNSVIATDIFDKDLKELRNKRWADAFYKVENEITACTDDDFNRKATIVIEHIIQAADVSHTMQHWHVYQKWNERLFEEMYLSYEAGRGGDKDPSAGWYKGELWFFDNYVIPLARKLKECGVFGVASAECLNYALQNRHEWERKGEAIVRKLKQEYASEGGI